MRDYNKSLRYRKHHHLGLQTFEKEGLLFHIVIGTITAVIFILFKIEYFKVIKASDFVFLIVFAIYQFILKPKIYRGEIKAYYRRTYETTVKSIYLYSFIGAISVWRFVAIAVYEILKTHNVSTVFTNIYHPIATPITIIISLFMFYLTYYQDKYTTIKEYSNRINYKIKELGMDENTATRLFLLEKDKEYGIKQFRGMYYDYDYEEEKSNENKDLDDEKKKNEEKKEENMIRRNPRQKNIKEGGNINARN